MIREHIVKYYNKFCEDKRLKSRHGQVEFEITMQYICDYIKTNQYKSVLDVGAGTGNYSVALSKMGLDVTAVELVNYNLGILKSKNGSVKAYQGDAVDLKMFKDNSFDVVLLLGPLYHMTSVEEKIKALSEAKRVVKNSGLIFVGYLLKDYAIIKHGFIDRFIKQEKDKGKIDNNFNFVYDKDDLYSYVTIEEVNCYNQLAGLNREKVFAPDGACDYIRQKLNELNKDEFQLFINYQKSVAERPDLMGACSHVVDILKKN